MGIAESFVRTSPQSQLAGVVMRRDLRIDGFGFSKVSVGGNDATDGVLRINRNLDRKDINALLLNGAVISWFNIIDMEKLYDELNLPIISLTYEDSEGLEDRLSEYFANSQIKLQLYRRLGERKSVWLKTGFDVYVRSVGVTVEEVRTLLDHFTLDGRVPEPVRVARLLARAQLKNELMVEKL